MKLSLEALQRDPFGDPPPYDPIWFAPDTEVVTLPTGRTYVTHDGTYPSVTTVLGSLADKSYLDDWRVRVGNDRATKITERALQRGSRMHAALEVALDVLRGISPVIAAENDWEALDLAAAIMESLSIGTAKNVCIEQPVWSKRLRVAGRVDLVSLMVDNEFCINDFKSSRRRKTAEQIPDYFKQCALYAMCFAERTDVWCSRIRISMAYGDGVCQGFDKFEARTNDWIDPAAEACRQYWLKRKLTTPK